MWIDCRIYLFLLTVIFSFFSITENDNGFGQKWLDNKCVERTESIANGWSSVVRRLR